jgi:uncharacterized protein (UPF0335 family)
MAEYPCIAQWKKFLEAVERFETAEREAKAVGLPVVTEPLGNKTPPGDVYTVRQIEEVSRKFEEEYAARRALLEAYREYADCRSHRS